MQNDGDGQPPQAAAEPSGRGYERNGPHSRYRGRVREKLKNPPATVNHLGLLLNLLEEGRRKTGRSAGTVDDFNLFLFADPEVGAQLGTLLNPLSVADFKNMSELNLLEEDGPHSRDRD
uniref:(northern house mosquito) hypothetical protein n=1 Tax=Culex pipiens TaxID=7175 RepID=A0A8D8A9P0_CULPI